MKFDQVTPITARFQIRMPNMNRNQDEASKTLIDIRSNVSSVHSNFTMAVAFHEVWKPAALDSELHQRMGRSYASQAFLIIRAALRREMLLALMRIWDTTKCAHSLPKIFIALEKPNTWTAIVEERACNLQDFGIAESVSVHLNSERTTALLEYQKYCKSGTHFSAFERLRRLIPILIQQ